MKRIKFSAYLSGLGLTDKTIKAYLFSVSKFRLENANAEKINYLNFLKWFQQLTNGNYHAGYLARVLAAVKLYFTFLQDTGKRKDHPCKNFNLKYRQDKTIIFYDLLKKSELELLLSRPERYPMLELRNKIIMSFLIYQGMYTDEIVNLKLSNLNFDERKVLAPGNGKINARWIDMTQQQSDWLEQYILKERKQLLKIKTNILLIGKIGKLLKTDDVNYLCSTFKNVFPGKKINPSFIRASLISVWINELKIPVEQVQLLSGQKWISTTLRYKQIDMKEEANIMNKCFPNLFDL